MNCQAQMDRLQGLLSKEEMDIIRTDIDSGIIPTDAINQSKLRTKTMMDNHPASMKTINDIQKDINNSKKKPVDSIEHRMVAEAGKGNTILNVESTKKAFRDSVLYKHYDTLNNLRNKLWGNKYSKNILPRMVKAIFGDTTDVEANQMLKEFNKINDDMHDIYTKTGGTKPKQRIGLQNDVDRILVDTEQDFVDNVMPLVKSSEDEVRSLYNKGLNGDDIADDILEFSDAEQYIKYNGMYGNNLWNSFMNGLEKTATESAFNKVFGATKGGLEKLMKDNKLNKAEQDRIISLQDALLGNTNKVMKGGETLSKYAKGARSIAAASMLGSATLSAVADFATVLVTANFNGMSATKTMFQGLSGLFKMKQNERLITQLGFVADDMVDGLVNTSRYDPNAAGTDILSLTTDKVLRASGLMAWTNSLKNSWKLSHLGHMANATQKSKTIPKNMKKQMDAYGITQKDWTEMRNQGGEFLDVTKLDDNLNYKMRQYINEESQYAILEPGASNQAYMALGTHAGTVKGEAVRTGTQFKSFMVAGVLTHLSRIYKLDTALDQAAYGAKMAMAGTMIGMLVVGLKDIKNGKDPSSREYNEASDYMEAFTESGIIGPMGEFIKPSKFGSSPFDQLGMAASPVVSKFMSLATKSTKLMTADDTEEALGNLMRDIASLTPGQNVSYSQYITNQFGRNSLLLINPDYQKRFNQIDRAKAARDSKNGLEDIPFFE